MIKEIDKRLEMLNGENYDVQFEVKNEEEFIKDVMEYFDVEEDEVNGYYPEDEEIKGDYVYSSLGGFTIKLEDALENEFGQARDNIEFYDSDIQEEILEWFGEDIEDYYKVNIERSNIINTMVKCAQGDGYIAIFDDGKVRFIELDWISNYKQNYEIVCYFHFALLIKAIFKKKMKMGTILMIL